MPVKALLEETVGRLLFRELTVSEVHPLAPRFRRLVLTGDGLRGAACAPGDKLQILISGAGTRTYSPFGHDRQRGAAQIVAYSHGDEPGARWAAAASQGDRIRVFGPRSSLALDALRGPVVLFGDETSFGVAAAAATYPRRVTAVLEVSSATDSAAALRGLGVVAELVERTLGDGHLADVEARLRAALDREPGARLVLTGKAQSIQTVRAALRKAPAVGKTLVKAYWSIGKRGLD
jgi:NADPH-dependent ferric siderophore reductase